MTDHLHDAEDVIAKAVKETVDPHAGLVKYRPAAGAAVKALIAAGWVPPGEGSADERLRATVLYEQDLARQAWEHTYRIEAERDAAGEFRMKFLGILFGLRDGFAQRTTAARIAGEPEPTYTGEQVMKWLDNMLDRSDRAAEKAKAKSLAVKQAEKPATPDAQDGLFEAAS